MGKPQSFQDLLFWKKAHQFVLAVYKETERFPEKEKYGLEASLEELLFQYRQTLQKVGKSSL